MGKIKKIVVLALCFVLFGNATVFAGYMYSLDGKEIYVEEWEEAEYYATGWYYAPVTIMYAPDGRTCVVEKRKVWDMKTVGWYETNSYTMYSADGRTINIAPWEIEAYENVGWYRYEKDAKQTLYSVDGREISVWKAEVESYLAVGWYYSPVTYLYSIDGRSILVAESEVYKYKQVGWYRKKDIEDMQENKKLASNFYIGQNVSKWSIFGTAYGTVRAIDYSTGKIKVYWWKVVDSYGNIDFNADYGLAKVYLYKEDWVNASVLD